MPALHSQYAFKLLMPSYMAYTQRMAVMATAEFSWKRHRFNNILINRTGVMDQNFENHKLFTVGSLARDCMQELDSQALHFKSN